MDNLFKWKKTSPYHLSVGAVLINNKKEVACHYFKTFEYKTEDIYAEDFYILMRETVQDNESLENSLFRGLKEEFGATGRISCYLGSIKSKFSVKNISVEKTTVYFLVELNDLNLNLRKKDDEEKGSIIQWKNIDFLINKMKEQKKRFPNNTDLDESLILERVKSKLG